MYTSFYNFKKKPFQLSADPEFIWLGKQHKEALDTLKYGVLDNEGFLLITGDVGTGKTTLINTLINSLTDDMIFASVPDPSLSRIDFFNYIAASFGIEKEFTTKGAFIAHFQKFLLDAHHRKKKVLLIIDESQLLTHELFEELRLLGNIERETKKLINIFFVGQNELIQILRQQKNRAVRQRLTLNYNIDPLTPDETYKYITHRLKVAGTNRTIFQASAVQEIFMYSGGFPRRINVICDNALLAGYVREKQIIDADIIHECAKDLDIKIYENHRDSNETEAPPLPDPAAIIDTKKVISGAAKKEKKRSGTEKALIGFIGLLLLFIGIRWGVLNTGFQFENLFSQNLDMNGVQETKIRYSMSTDQEPLDKDNRLSNKKKGWEEAIPPETIPNYEVLRQVDENKISVEREAGIKKEDLTLSAIPPSKEQTRLNKSHQDVADLSPDQSASMKKGLFLPEEPIIIRFKYDTNTPIEKDYSKLKDFAEALLMYPEKKIMISGYTDFDGNNYYNLKLSEFRANLINSYLVGKGIDPSQMESKGFGSSNPIASNSTSQGKMMNRRVEIKLKK